MMMMGDKKKMITTVVGKLNGDAPASAGPVESDASVGKKAAFRKLMSAVHSKDEASGVAALEDFLELHDDGGSEEMSEGESEYGE